MPYELDLETKCRINMEEILASMREAAITSAKIAKELWPPDSNPEIIKACNREYYSQFEGDLSYFLQVYDEEIDKYYR